MGENILIVHGGGPTSVINASLYGAVKEAKKYECKITLIKDGKSGDCKKIFGLMGLAVKNGNEVTMTFDGTDEDVACEAVEAFMKANL